jgi:hypothetical protein
MRVPTAMMVANDNMEATGSNVNNHALVVLNSGSTFDIRVKPVMAARLQRGGTFCPRGGLKKSAVIHA